MLRRSLIVVPFLLHLLFSFGYADPAPNCTRLSSIVNSESEFEMVQHQLRGSLKINDDCSFRVSQFDMLPGSDVHWWGAQASDFVNLTAGFIVSNDGLNGTYNNSTFDVHLLSNVSWSKINVLAVWDRATASDFGHVVLRNEAPATTPPPTVFENCKVLSKNFRLRWTLNVSEDSIEIGLEAATGITNYMAFGWANSSAEDSDLMIGADIAVAGFMEDGMPFVDDFFITKYSECVRNSDGVAQGVCPDSFYEGPDGVGLVNNSMLIYGHRKDGVTFVRYRRHLTKVDEKYDHPVNHSANMKVIWALGRIKPPDSINPYYLPQNHGAVNYGHLVLNVSEHVNECTGPLDAEDKEDQSLITADAKVPLVVSSAPAMHYPNPPNPEKVLYINKKEAPVLRVERGVPVKFSIQAGHDVALYITSDPLGGNATTRNLTETIYAGGPEAHGVQASPTELVWAPDRNTPDHVYYHSLYDQKMGWKVEVVDGGLSDMYNNSVILDDQQVTFFWTLSKDSISIAVRGEKKSGYIAVGFGSGMVNSYVYVGWIDDTGIGHVNSYWIDGKDASSIHRTKENLTHVRCKTENGIITFEFTRPLDPSCRLEKRVECKNIIDPTTSLKVVWAMGAKWANDHLTDRNMHSSTSNRPILVHLMRGSAEAEQDLLPVLAVHGFMMFIAWGILLPGGILAARYLKHLKGDGWYRIHVYLQYSGLVIVLLALLFAVAELRGFYFSSAHVKCGFATILLACIQPVNAFLRPQKPANGEQASSKRVIWEYFHGIVGRCAVVVGIAALFTGMKHLGDRYDVENVHGLKWAMAIWFLIGALIVIYLEYHERQRIERQISGRGNWVLGNLEEDDSVDLLRPTRTIADKQLQPSARMEVQLEPLNR
ncbi:cytochrome b561, DM13 and DOMON domain-containing protein At5g54830-like [Glycine soja]|uniref:Cytochrome b561, DM13 and DOMON domain-containing protein n=1 Tax=Glycine soja TaxID=3848 RepID=A0A445JE00_GLYSO|nr:cytochrome b561, DM13 and DOMON domain-containing protein At5g54830-like [Glycine soja]XP_028243698.1 cytochrome b561, DM13 and DOMON domain-containing protein At5g54830-like [Glycine soja]XP_028243699.1 cytochrome b561, DM13 and DOMON domain-containing protein At5g54830-like [Glycine soja]RZB96664.1 Cytochrome b561, DM13 and DOMON domain-containing protein [Glycine soja]